MPEKTTISDFARNLLEEKLDEFLSQYDLGDEQEPLKEMLRDLQSHAFDIGVYALNMQLDEEEESKPQLVQELDDIYTLDRDTLVKLMLSTDL